MSAPTNLTHINGNILELEFDFICHQINQVSSKAKGLAASIFQQYPYSDRYTKRKILGQTTAVPGLYYEYPGENKETSTLIAPVVVGFAAQMAPGQPGDRFAKYYNVDESKDTAECRLEYFKWCLKNFAYDVSKPNCLITKTDRRIAFPYQIGCGLAGGNWPDYEKAIWDFAASLIDSKCNISVFIVQNK